MKAETPITTSYHPDIDVSLELGSNNAATLPISNWYTQVDGGTWLSWYMPRVINYVLLPISATWGKRFTATSHAHINQEEPQQGDGLWSEWPVNWQGCLQDEVLDLNWVQVYLGIINTCYYATTVLSWIRDERKSWCWSCSRYCHTYTNNRFYGIPEKCAHLLEHQETESCRVEYFWFITNYNESMTWIHLRPSI